MVLSCIVSIFVESIIRKKNMKKLFIIASVVAITTVVAASFSSVVQHFNSQTNDQPFKTESVELEDGKFLGLNGLYKSEQLQILAEDFKVPPGVELKNHKTKLNSFDSFHKYALFIGEMRGYGYFANGKDGDQTLPFFLYSTREEGKRGYDFDKTADFNTYYHGIFKNKVLREQAFKYAMAALLGASDRFPGDWLPAAIKYVDELIAFTNSKGFPSADFKDFSAPDYWSGFIARRVHVDKVPKAEIVEYLNKVKQTLQAMKPSTFSHFSTVTINNELELKLGVSHITAKSIKSGKELMMKRADMITLKGNTYTFTKYNWPNEDEEVKFVVD